MGTTEVYKLVNDLMLKHTELKTWGFAFHNKKVSFGTCSYSRKMIYLSSYFFSSMTDEAIKNVLTHEIAHALTKGHGHDYIWRRKCIELGGNGERTENIENIIHNNTVLQSKYTLTCPCCGVVIPKHKKPKYNSSCGKCSGGKYNENYKLILTQNY